MRGLIPILIAMFALTACAGPEITSEMKEMHKDSMTSQTECYKTESDKLIAEATALESMTKDQAFAYMMSKHTSEAILAATGVSMDPCSGTNIFDYMARVAESQNKTVQETLGDFMGAVKTVGQILAVAQLVDSASGDSTTVTGDGNSDIGNTDISTTTNVQTHVGDSGANNNNSTTSEIAEEVSEEVVE